MLPTTLYPPFRVQPVAGAASIHEDDRTGRFGVIYLRALLAQAGVVHNEMSASFRPRSARAGQNQRAAPGLFCPGLSTLVVGGADGGERRELDQTEDDPSGLSRRQVYILVAVLLALSNVATRVHDLALVGAR
jgi:hypothetical protein